MPLSRAVALQLSIVAKRDPEMDVGSGNPLSVSEPQRGVKIAPGQARAGAQELHPSRAGQQTDLSYPVARRRWGDAARGPFVTE